MANYYQTLNFAFQTPQPSEDLDIPGDMKLLADQVDATLLQQINNNVVSGVVVTTDGPTNSGSVSNGVLNLNIIPEVDVSTKYNVTGGTISGNATITGTLTVNGATTVPTPTLSTHAVNKAYVDTAISAGRIIGEITMYGNANAPTGWLLCDGSAIPSQYTALRAIYGTNTPDLRNKFVVGAGGTYGVRSPVGSNTATLATANLPAHNHGGTVATDTSHDHPTTNPTSLGNHNHAGSSANTGSGSHSHTTNWTGEHSHGAPYRGDFIRFGDEPSGNAYSFITQSITYATQVNDGGHSHTANSSSESHGHSLTMVDANMGHSHATVVNSRAQSHAHNINIEGSGAAFSIVPLSYALTYIVFAGV
jgi:microcystin-dependent protein